MDVIKYDDDIVKWMIITGIYISKYDDWICDNEIYNVIKKSHTLSNLLKLIFKNIDDKSLHSMILSSYVMIYIN